MADFIKQGISVRFVGDRSLFPESVRSNIDEVERKTKHLDKLFLNMLFCYGGRQEVVSATKKIAEKVKNGDLGVDEIDENLLISESWMGAIPDPDLIIRTGQDASRCYHAVSRTGQAGG